jgi:hypothetical protein
VLENGDRSFEEDVSVEVIRNFEELDSIREFWEKVQWHPYTNLDYYLEFAREQQGFIAPYVVLLKMGGKPSSLLIGYIREIRLNLKIGYKTVFRPKARCIYIEYAGVLGDASFVNCVSLISKLQSCLHKGEADFAYFKFVKHDSKIFDTASQIPSFFLKDHFPLLNPHWAVTLPSSFDEYCKNRSKRIRESTRRVINRIEKKYGADLSIRCFQNEDDIAQAMKDIETVASKTYQRGLGVGFHSSNKAVNEWLFAADKKWLRAYVLYLNKQPCAFLTGLSYRNVYFIETLGFDMAYQFYSPGTYLFLQIIKELCADANISCIDMGLGDAEYKRRYCDQKWNDAAVYIYAPSINGLRINLARSFVALIDQNAKAVLNNIKMLSWVKKRWRRRVVPVEG